jgi:HSP20 family protein
MTITTYNPFDLQVDGLINDALRGLDGRYTDRAPEATVWEDANQVGVELTLPAWDAKDVTITVNDDVLTVKGTRNWQDPEGRRYHMRETGGQAQFARSFVLPVNVDWDKADASFTNGVLRIVFPKAEDAKPKQITIR